MVLQISKRAHVRIVAIGAALLLAGATLSASAGPILQYSFPASYANTGTTVTDLSPAGNNGIVSTTVAKQPAVSSVVLPPNATAGTDSLATSNGATAVGGIQTTNTSLLNNPTLAAAGGFTYALEFLWNGTDSTSNQHIQKLIDYAGTEALQVNTSTTAANPGTAQLTFIFTTQGAAGPPVQPDITTGPALTILPNIWYFAYATFDTQGNPVAGDGSINGLATLTAGPVGGGQASASLAVTKTIYGDGTILGPRPIGIGELGFPSTSAALVPLFGNLYNPSVSLGVPEPASLGLLSLVGLGFVRRRRSR